MVTGNLHLLHSVCSWNGGLSFNLIFNSQSNRTSALGSRWTHSFNWQVIGTDPAVVVDSDGGETTFALSGGQYVSPVGCYDTLSKNADGTWNLTKKGGLSYLFRPDGLLSAIADASGNMTTLSYAGATLTGVTDTFGRTLAFGYNGGSLTTVTDYTGRSWTLAYQSGQMVSVSEPPLAGTIYSTRWSYDANGCVTSIRDRAGNTWQYAYGSQNAVTQMQDMSGEQWQVSYGGAISPSSPPAPRQAARMDGPISAASTTGASSPTDLSASYGFDTMGRVVSVTDPLGRTTQYNYDSANNRIARQTPGGLAWQSSYDGQGNLIAFSDPQGNQTTRVYDNQSCLLSATEAGNTTSYTYNAAGNAASVTYPDGSTIQYAYNGRGQLTIATDPAGHTAQYGHDAMGNLSSVTTPTGGTTRYQYQGHLPVQRTDACGRVTHYIYDAWDRLIGVQYPQSAPLTFTYDAMNRATQSVDGTGTRTYQYDAWGRKIAMSDPMGTTTAAYDALGRLTSQTDVTGRQINYNYDAAGQLLQVSDDSSAVGYAYTANGRVSSLRYSNGVQTTYAYDALGRVNSLEHRRVGDNSLIAGYNAQRDTLYRMAQVTETASGDVTAFQYDATGSMTREERTGSRPYLSEYGYDATGQTASTRRSENSVVSANIAIAQPICYTSSVLDKQTNTTQSLTWNADNTLTSLPANGYTMLFDYDEERRLIRIRHDYGGGSVQLAYEYGYGADGGRRWTKDYISGVQTWYPCGVACSAGTLVELTRPLSGGAWQTGAQYLRAGTGCSSRLIRRNNEFHHFDLFGSAAVITDGGGNVLANDVFDSASIQRYSQGGAQTPWRWQGVRIGEDGLRFSVAGIITDSQSITALTVDCGISTTLPGSSYCGPNGKTPYNPCDDPPKAPTPTDAVDACCKAHDCCWKQYSDRHPGKGDCLPLRKGINGECAACNKTFCNCVDSASCSTDQCRSNQSTIKKLACNGVVFPVITPVGIVTAA